MRTRRLCLQLAGAWLLVALVLLWSMAAWAAQPDIELRWSAPAGCPEKPLLMAALAEALAESTVREHLQVEALVRAPASADQTWKLDLRLDGEGMSGERHLEGDSCSALAKSAVLVIAMAYDPLNAKAPTAVTPEPNGAGGSGQVPAPTPDTPTPDTPSPVPPGPAPPGPAPPGPVPPPLEPAPPRPTSPPFVLPPGAGAVLRPSSETRPSIGIAAQLLGDAGTLPRAAAGVGGEVRLRWRRWTVGLVGSYLPPVTGEVAEQPTAGGEVSSWTVGVSGCGVPWTTRRAPPRGGDLALRLCVGGAAGQMLASGFGVTVPADGAVPWGMARATAGLDVWLVAPLLLVTDLSLGVPVTRPNFFINNVGDVHTPGPVHGRLGLGLELSL